MRLLILVLKYYYDRVVLDRQKYINPKCDFKIVWVQCDLQDSDSQLTYFLDCYVFKTSKERYLFTSLLQGEIQNSIFFLQKFPSISPENHEMENSYNFLTILLPLHVLCAREWEKKKDRSSIMSYIKEKLVSDISLARQCTEVRFASFLSGGFITDIVVNPPERKLAKHTSVQWK